MVHHKYTNEEDFHNVNNGVSYSSITLRFYPDKTQFFKSKIIYYLSFYNTGKRKLPNEKPNFDVIKNGPFELTFHLLVNGELDWLDYDIEEI